MSSYNKRKRRKKQKRIVFTYIFGATIILLLAVVFAIAGIGSDNDSEDKETKPSVLYMSKQYETDTVAAIKAATETASEVTAGSMSVVDIGTVTPGSEEDSSFSSEEEESEALSSSAAEEETESVENADTTALESDADATEKESVESVFHNLPVIYLTTDNGGEITSKEVYTAGTFALAANGVEDFEDVELKTMQIRGRGCSSWTRWPKKSFKIKFDEKVSLMGKAKDKDWILIANFYDRSLTRNHLAGKLAKTLDNLYYTPDSYPVDVFFNGEYYGVYELCEQIEVAGGRVDIETDETQTDSGFLIEIGGSNGGFYVGKLPNIEIKYPKSATDDQTAYIKDYITKVNSLITTGADLATLSEYIDVDNFVDWTLLIEYTYNFDAGYSRNVFMYKEPGGRLRLGPIWDFDLSMGSLGYDDPTYQNWATSMNGMIGETWTTHLLENPEFFEKMKTRWLVVRDTLDKKASEVLDELLPILGPSYLENYDRWMTEYEGKNIKWEWPYEYLQTELSGLYMYIKGILAYRYTFLNRTLLEGYVCEQKPVSVNSPLADR